MIKILFVCHGNICRSPMAEFVLKDMVKKLGVENQFEIASAATSTEEIGNPVHSGTRNKLREVGISCDGKYAVQITVQDYEYYDYIIGMDSNNIRNMKKIWKQQQDKIYQLLEFAGDNREIADPWYSHDFDATYSDVVKGCNAFLYHIKTISDIDFKGSLKK